MKCRNVVGTWTLKRRIRRRDATCAPTVAAFAKSASTLATGLLFGRRYQMRERRNRPGAGTCGELCETLSFVEILGCLPCGEWFVRSANGDRDVGERTDFGDITNFGWSSARGLDAGRITDFRSRASGAGLCFGTDEVAAAHRWPLDVVSVVRRADTPSPVCAGLKEESHSPGPLIEPNAGRIGPTRRSRTGSGVEIAIHEHDIFLIPDGVCSIAILAAFGWRSCALGDRARSVF